MKKRAEPIALKPLGPMLLSGIALAESALAVYQWMELLNVRSGGKAVCALSETVNCAAVWSSPFASWVHAFLRMPVAALGLVWGLGALAVAAAVALKARARADVEVPVSAARLVAALGVVSVVVFAIASFQAKAVCLTCVGTYVLVLGYAAAAWKLLPGPFPPRPKVLKSSASWGAVAFAVPYALLLYPGSRTPANASGPMSELVSAASASPAEADAKLASFLGGLSWAEQQAVSDSLALYKSAPTVDVSRFSTRMRYGPEGAPVRLVEFTDVRCGHCRVLVEVLSQLKRVSPPDALSVEPRHFPLDSECNQLVGMSDGTGIRCAAARAQICLEGAPDYWSIQEKLFREQASLTKEKVVEIASSGSVPREQLVACMQSQDTARKLNEDIAYAALFNPEGTPLVVVNGKKATPVAAWLYAMVMTRGDVASKAFEKLPPARP